ncbi:hypothetical protein ES703_77681 [subsurface metagenome]
MAMSTPSVVLIWGRRINVLMPENLGDSRGSTGLYPSIETHSLFRRKKIYKIARAESLNSLL